MNKDQGQIVAFLGVAVVFALIGHTKKASTATAGGDAKIILGGGLSAVLLTLLSEGGEAAGEFARGLALLAMVSSILINGTAVFSSVSKLTSATSSTPTLVTTPKE